MGDPSKISHVSLTADGFTISDDPLKIHENKHSTIAQRIKAGWGDRRQSHSVPAAERFETEQKRGFNSTTDLAQGFPQERAPRHYHEFTKSFDCSQLKRQVTQAYRGARPRAAGS